MTLAVALFWINGCFFWNFVLTHLLRCVLLFSKTYNMLSICFSKLKFTWFTGFFVILDGNMNSLLAENQWQRSCLKVHSDNGCLFRYTPLGIVRDDFWPLNLGYSGLFPHKTTTKGPRDPWIIQVSSYQLFFSAASASGCQTAGTSMGPVWKDVVLKTQTGGKID